MEQSYIPSLKRIQSAGVLAVGLGKRSELDTVRLRNALQSAGRYLRKHGARRVAVLVSKPVLALGPEDSVARAVVVGMTLENFDAGAL
jgi:hypothetical protein